jgi:hypothetical protein
MNKSKLTPKQAKLFLKKISIKNYQPNPELIKQVLNIKTEEKK